MTDLGICNSMSEKIFSPLVQDKTRTQSESIQTVVLGLKNGLVYIPDYQRDAEQWDSRKKSLFIESLLNNLTIPAFFFGEDEDGNNEVIDGQQRLNTIWQFADDKFTISNNSSIEYLAPLSALYAGRKFSQLSQKLKTIFNTYPLTIIYIPKSIPLQTKLEIFRRINEGGTPLSGQDIRLAYYSQSKAVTFIRLVGIHDDPNEIDETVLEDNDEIETIKKASQRMLELAQNKGLSNPWDKYPDARDMWYQWWEGKEKAKGQTPSLMFLWYLVCLERLSLDNLLKRGSHLKLPFGGQTENALDIYCNQLQYQEFEGKSQTNIIANLDLITGDYFQKFADWMEIILSRTMAGVGVDKYKQIALFIAGAVELNISPLKVSDEQWNLINNFIRKPRETGKKILAYDGYPEAKGSWGGKRGQKEQCDAAAEIARTILKLMK
jgi:hypothetical protein